MLASGSSADGQRGRAALCAADWRGRGEASKFRGFDTIEALTYTSTTSAAAITRIPTRPHSVDVRTVTRKSAERLVPSLLARSTPLGCARSGRATRLVAVREYLRAHLDEPVQTAALAAISGLTECHLIRSFHLEFGLPPPMSSVK